MRVSFPVLVLAGILSAQDSAAPVDARAWNESRRPALLRLFENSVFGRAPLAKPKAVDWRVVAEYSDTVDRSENTKTVRISFGSTGCPALELAMVLPSAAKPVPVFLIAGNARLKLKPVLDRGYGIVACRVDQIQSDAPSGYRSSIRACLGDPGDTEATPGKWGAIGAWSWALSRAMDYLETDPQIDGKRVFVNGFARYAKAALWAAAQDQRFAAVFSGEGGYDRSFASIRAGRFDYWLTRGPADSAAAQFDWGDLISLLAPRPVYLATAAEDTDDVNATFAAARRAATTYRLFGFSGFAAGLPSVNTSIGDRIGFHRRTGEHPQDAYDWQQYLNFADRHFSKP